MKKIEAIVRKELFEKVYKALEKSGGVGGITVTPAQGFGHHRNGLKDKMKIEIYTDEFSLDKIVDLIRKNAMTGTTGDGKIAILPLDNIIKIRTGEDGAGAI